MRSGTEIGTHACGAVVALRGEAVSGYKRGQVKPLTENQEQATSRPRHRDSPVLFTSVVECVYGVVTKDYNTERYNSELDMLVLAIRELSPNLPRIS